MPNSAILLIGNELLSGRTQDKNLAHLAATLGALGIPLAEARVVRDEEAAIIAAVNALRTSYDYVFTTGGIGPTHDDITTACIARAFGVVVERNAEAETRLRAHYPVEKINAARLKMADIPAGATLIDNPVSAAPGFCIENVYVMAGVPSIFQAMLANVAPNLTGGAPVRSRSLVIYVTEGTLAEGLGKLQTQYPNVEIGSYPFIRADRLGTAVVLRSADEDALNQASTATQAFLTTQGEVTEE